MKRLSAVLLVLILCIGLCACSRRSYINENSPKVTTAETRDGFAGVTAPPADEITDAVTTEDAAETAKKKAIDAVRANTGETDSDTGLKYSFSFDGTEFYDGEEMIKIRVSIRTSDGISTVCGTYLADKNGNVTEYN